MEQRCQGTLRIWAEPFTPLRVPKLFNLRTDPYEYADITSNTYYDWFMQRDFFVFYVTAMATQFLDTFKEFPPRHPAGQLQHRPGGGQAARVPSEGLEMPDKKPNILVIWGDDIGISNLSCYSRGMMGYFTPNIDRIADEGMLFTDSYGEQSCTAGRSSFITGQSVYRTGMSKVGMPGVDVGLQKEDPTIAELLKPLGYATGPVRQEPPRRPEQVPADRARLRRVLRQPVSPQRRGGAGERGLSHRGRGAAAAPSAAAARGHPLLGHRRGLRRGRRPLRPGRASNASRTPDR